MADSSTLSFRVEGDIIDSLEDAAGQAGISRSVLAREAMLVGLSELAGGADPYETDAEIDVPDHLGHDAQVRRMIARNKKERRQGKFRSEFSKQLKQSFKNNETPGEFKRSVAGYLEEAEDMGEIPQEVREDLDRDAETYREWADHMLEYYTVAYQSKSFDHDPVDDPLGNHEGVQNAKHWVNWSERINEAKNRRERRKKAQHALEAGAVPEHVAASPSESDDPLETVVSAARELQEAQSQLTTGSDAENPKLED